MVNLSADLMNSSVTVARPFDLAESGRDSLALTHPKDAVNPTCNDGGRGAASVGERSLNQASDARCVQGETVCAWPRARATIGVSLKGSVPRKP